MDSPLFPGYTYWALDITESLLGLGWNEPRRFWLWDDGLINAARALFTKSPSTVPILTSEFVIADLRAFSLFDGYDDVPAWLGEFLWRPHRNEPGWFVGEHIHVRFFWLLRAPLLDLFTTWLRLVAEIDLLGEPERSIENRTDDDGELEEPERLTRVGEVDLWRKREGRDEKAEDEEEANEDMEPGEQNLPEGDWERRTGPLYLLEDAAIFA